MKLIILVLISFQLFIACQEQSTDIDPSNSPGFSSDRSMYTAGDTLFLEIHNTTDSNMEIGLRCGQYLEMYYQAYENGLWSDDLWFEYMTLKCATLLDTIKAHDSFFYSLPSETFDTTGTYRLKLPYSLQGMGGDTLLYSNTFEIK